MRNTVLAIIAMFSLTLSACPASNDVETREPADSVDAIDVTSNAPDGIETGEGCILNPTGAADCSCQCPGSDEWKGYSIQPCEGEFPNQVLDRCSEACLAHYCPNPCPGSRTKEEFTACSASNTEEDCKAAGGEWGLHGLTQVPWCSCPTGQGGCPCTKASDCFGRCAFIESSGGVDLTDPCDGITTFTCTERHTTGCHCQILDDDGNVGVLCVD